MAGWASLTRLLNEEFTQAVEEGKDTEAVERIRAAFQGGDDSPEAIVRHFSDLIALEMRPDYEFDEPSDLAGIRRLSTSDSFARIVPIDTTTLFDKLYGAWLGRCVGCALGKPVEAFMLHHNGLSSWQRQKRFLTAIDESEWPIDGYVPLHSPAETETGTTWGRGSSRETIRFMETDDDIRYTVLGQLVLQNYGVDFTSANVARTWMERLPYNFMCTAETQAYRNIVLRWDQLRDQDPSFEKVDPETTVDWEWTATHLNPYREWIGAQIRIDSYGYACPGDPARAAELAFADARISHTKNGIYGAMLCAAMIAAAFTASDAREVVAAGLAQIPTTSRLYQELQFTIELCDRYDNDFDNFEKIIEALYERLDHYNPTHAINNSAVCVAAVLLSQGDFATGIRFAVMAGWDTDCNGATVGSIVGAMTGAARAPEKWVAPLNDTLNSALAGYHPIAISECASRSLTIATPELKVAL
ncbi:hypothetical protein B7R22_17600 [Subtercola boreus]|uniref:ADP-ribosylglycohydrolase n=1 Tax=Subtercola boreus TaxID=120213 RepID=A0A3E0VQC6_9MICO|nr:ADP-ribosylglycohydrolase family protein [Subtercola boreus]RFA11829.1 hypothetical protein B7R22_17600 [Subtercola boreus]